MHVQYSRLYCELRLGFFERAAWSEHAICLENANTWKDCSVMVWLKRVQGNFRLFHSIAFSYLTWHFSSCQSYSRAMLLFTGSALYSKQCMWHNILAIHMVSWIPKNNTWHDVQLEKTTTHVDVAFLVFTGSVECWKTTHVDTAFLLFTGSAEHCSAVAVLPGSVGPRLRVAHCADP